MMLTYCRLVPIAAASLASVSRSCTPIGSPIFWGTDFAARALADFLSPPPFRLPLTPGDSTWVANSAPKYSR